MIGDCAGDWGLSRSLELVTVTDGGEADTDGGEVTTLELCGSDNT